MKHVLDIRKGHIEKHYTDIDIPLVLLDCMLQMFLSKYHDANKKLNKII